MAENNIIEKNYTLLSPRELQLITKALFLIQFLGSVRRNPEKLPEQTGVCIYDPFFKSRCVSKAEIIRWQHAGAKDEVQKMTSEEFDVLITLYPGFGKVSVGDPKESIFYYCLAY